MLGSETDRDGRLREALRAAFDRPAASVTRQSSRPGNATWRVTFADRDPVYLKTARDRTRIAREAAATRYAAARADAAVPRVVACDPTGRVPYLATEPATGVAAARRWPDAPRATARAAGGALARFHTTAFDAPGVVTGVVGDPHVASTDTSRPPTLAVREETWTETLAATVERREAAWLPDRFGDLAGHLAATVRAVDPPEPPAHRLLHDDPTRSNVRVDPPGLIDVERGLIGDPALDVVSALTHLARLDAPPPRRRATRRAFLCGYRSTGRLPATGDHLSLYRAVAHLLRLQAFDDHCVLIDRSPDETERALRATFERLLTAARGASD